MLGPPWIPRTATAKREARLAKIICASLRNELQAWSVQYGGCDTTFTHGDLIVSVSQLGAVYVNHVKFGNAAAEAVASATQRIIDARAQQKHMCELDAATAAVEQNLLGRP